MDLHKLTKIAMLLSLSVVLGLIESFIPLVGSVVPGLKLGLANIIVIFALYTLSFKDALYISVMRVFLIGLLRTGLFNIIFFFSLFGAIFSIVTMFLAKKYTKLSLVGISVVGSLFHSIGQIVVVMIGLSNVKVIFYLPYLLLFSIPTGIIVGLLSKKVLDYFQVVENKKPR